MGKTLLLLRHAQTEGFSRSGLDFDRELTPEGRQHMQAQANYMHQTGLIPGYALISNAKRTQQSWQVLSDNWQPNLPDAAIEESLYLAEPETLQASVARLPQELESALILAHNPGLQQLTQLYDPHFSAEFNTSMLVVIQIAAESWSEVANAHPTGAARVTHHTA